jgi:hypothetical protein
LLFEYKNSKKLFKNIKKQHKNVKKQTEFFNDIILKKFLEGAISNKNKNFN